MELLPIFSTPVWMSVYPDFEEHKETFLSCVRNFRKNNPQPDPNMREWIGIIKAADYFIGCDSCGQHFAKAVGTKSSVLVAGTHKNNVSYPDEFHIIERNCEFYPAPMRICSMDSSLATRLNEERIQFTDEEIENAYQEIIQSIENKQENTVDSRKIQEISTKIGKYV